MKSYQDVIRELREDNDFTQAAVASAIGISTVTQYSKYERGINELPIKYLIAICKFYNVSADYILGLKRK